MRLAVANVADSNNGENEEDHLSRTKTKEDRTGNGLINADSFRPVTD